MPAPSLGSSRFVFCLSLFFLALLTAGVVAPEQGGIVASVVMYEGLMVLAWLAAAHGIGAWLLPKTIEAGVLRSVTATAIGLGVMSLLTLLLGTLGALSAGTAWVLIGVGIALAVIRAKTGGASARVWMFSPVGDAWFTLPVAIPLGVMLVSACVLPGVLWGADDPAGYDVVAYHLQLPREWFELGRVTTLPHNVFSFMPLNVEMHYLLAMHLMGGAFKAMYLAQLMHGAFIALTVLAVFGATRSMVATLVCAAVPWMFMLGGVAYNEGGLMLYTTLAVVWALRGRWAIAGACAGLAAGCKLTGVTSAMVFVPVVIGSLSVWERVRGRTTSSGAGESHDPPPNPLPQAGGGEVIRGLAVFALVSMLVFSPWLIRTALASGGNPVFPLAANVLGHGQLDAGQVERFVVAHAARPDQQSLAGRLAALWQQVGGDYHFGSIGSDGVVVPLWLLLVVPALWLARKDRAAWACLTLIVGNVLVWLFATHLQGRFLVQIVPLVALMAAAGKGRARIVFVTLLVIVGLFSWSRPLTTLRGLLVAVGVPDPSALRETLPSDVASAIYETDRPLYLIGDAKAFWYPVPTSRLHYRSVFDVRSDRPFKQAWLGDEVPGDALILVDPSELARFEKTYRNLPKMPEAWRGRSEPFVVRAGDVP